jgi:hypothetical protein
MSASADQGITVASSFIASVLFVVRTLAHDRDPNSGKKEI